MILSPLAAYLLVGAAASHLMRDPFGDRSVYYRISTALLLGMGGLAFLYVIMDLAGIPITRWSTMIAALAAGAPSLALRIRRGGIESLHPSGFSLPGWGRLSLPCLLFCAPLILIAAGSFVQMSLLVPRAYDALVGWDLVGKVLSYEGALRNSVFEKIVYNAQATYPPFAASMQGLFYLFTPHAPRLWVPIMLVAFMVVLGEEAWRIVGSSALAALLLLIVLTLPELSFHLTVAQTDFPNMVFVTIGFLWALRYPRDRRAVWLCALFIFFGTMTRSETVLVAAAVSLWMLARVRFRRWEPVVVTAASAAFFLFWNLIWVRGLIGYDPGDHFRSTIDLDLQRAWDVIRFAVIIVSHREPYGELLPILGAGFLLWVLWAAGLRRRAGESVEGMPATPGAILGLFALSLAFYLPFFYMWDPVLNPLWTMEHTFKRGFFRYVPLAVLFVMVMVRLAWEALRPAPARTGSR
jgi:hypothetical protein